MVDRQYGNPNRHYGELTVFDCPSHRVAAVLEIIARHNLAAESDGVGLLIGEPYRSFTFDAGGASDIAGELRQIAPEGVYEVRESPQNGWLGNLFHLHPEHGEWMAAHDGEEAVYTEDQIRHALATDSLEALFGTAWSDEIARLQSVTGPQLLTHQPTIPADRTDDLAPELDARTATQGAVVHPASAAGSVFTPPQEHTGSAHPITSETTTPTPPPGRSTQALQQPDRGLRR